jgi:hypothetical protein
MFTDAIGFIFFVMFVILGTVEPLIIVLTKPDHPFFHSALLATVIAIAEIAYWISLRYFEKNRVSFSKTTNGVTGAVSALLLIPAFVGVIVWFAAAGIVVVNYDNTCENFAAHGGPNPNGACKT